LKFKTPYEKVIEEYKNNPNVFLINPDQKKLELNTYGYRRIAIALAINPKRVFRVMRLFGLKVKKPPSKPKFNYQKKSEDNKLVRKNLIADFNLSQPNQVWSSDFTYIKFQQKFLYLATILDTYTRKIVA